MPWLPPQLYAASRAPIMPLGNREGGARQGSASQETCHRSWSRTSASGGVNRWKPETTSSAGRHLGFGSW